MNVDLGYRRGYELIGGRAVVVASALGVASLLADQVAPRLLRHFLRTINLLAAGCATAAVTLTAATGKGITWADSWRFVTGGWTTLVLAIAWALIGAALVGGIAERTVAALTLFGAAPLAILIAGLGAAGAYALAFSFHFGASAYCATFTTGQCFPAERAAWQGPVAILTLTVALALATRVVLGGRRSG